MSAWQAIFLGILQGFTEFLPVSSSGHLALVQHLFHVNLSAEDLLAFDLFIHLGTLLALTSVYRSEVLGFVRLPLSLFKREGYATPEDRMYRRLFLLIVIATLPAVIVGLLFKHDIEALFENIRFLPYFFMFTGVCLLSTFWAEKRLARATSVSVDPLTMTTRRALGVGLAQAVAILPGVSRSGSTIVAGLWLKLRPDWAAHFSFLLAMPVTLGAAILSLKDVNIVVLLQSPYMWLGFVASFVSGWLCLVSFIRIIKRGKLYLFGGYCILLGILVRVFVV